MALPSIEARGRRLGPVFEIAVSHRYRKERHLLFRTPRLMPYFRVANQHQPLSSPRTTGCRAPCGRDLFVELAGRDERLVVGYRKFFVACHEAELHTQCPKGTQEKIGRSVFNRVAMAWVRGMEALVSREPNALGAHSE